jgi:acetyltransferase-like isoleucine patch superfamily enzyme
MINKMLSIILTKIRRESSVIDSRIPVDYLIVFAIRKFCGAVRGAIMFLEFSKMCIVGKNVRLRCRRKIKFFGAINLSDDCYVDALSVNGVCVGENFSMGRGASIECTGSLRDIGVGFNAGNNVGIGSFSFLGCAGGVSIGGDTILGNFVGIHSENHRFSDSKIPIRLQGVTREGIVIGNNCWIGAKVTILDGVEIGDGCVVAAGSTVLKGLYPGKSVLAGSPAKIIRRLGGE